MFDVWKTSYPEWERSTSAPLCSESLIPVRVSGGDLGAAEAPTDAAAETHCPPDKSSPKSRIAKPFFEYIPSKRGEQLQRGAVKRAVKTAVKSKPTNRSMKPQIKHLYGKRGCQYGGHSGTIK